MGISADAADPVTADAHRFSGAAVTTGALGWIAPGRAAVFIGLSGRPEPSRWMRAARIRTRCGQSEAGVTRLARVLAVARAAQPRLSPRLLGVSRAESGAVHASSRHVVEQCFFGQRGDRLAVTAGAEPLAVAGLAQIAGGRGAHPVLANIVAVVHKVALRTSDLGR